MMRELCVSSMPIDAERITAGRVLLVFWQMSLSDQRMRDRYLAEGREDGDVVTGTPGGCPGGPTGWTG